MASVKLPGVHLLPSTGEFAYDTIPYFGFQRGEFGLDQAFIMNFFAGAPGGKTDYAIAMDQLQALHPECTTVSLVIAWFFDSEDAATCNVYPTNNTNARRARLGLGIHESA